MTNIIHQSMYRIPSFTKGVARTVSLVGGLDSYATSRTPQEADTRALREDWQAVGKDLNVALHTYGKSHKK